MKGNVTHVRQNLRNQNNNVMANLCGHLFPLVVFSSQIEGSCFKKCLQITQDTFKPWPLSMKRILVICTVFSCVGSPWHEGYPPKHEVQFPIEIRNKVVKTFKEWRIAHLTISWPDLHCCEVLAGVKAVRNLDLMQCVSSRSLSCGAEYL